jgi:hypothetical protein
MEAVLRSEVYGFFLVNSGHFLAKANHFLVNYNHFFVNFRGKRPESYRKKSKNSGRNTASISHRFPGVFLQDPVTFPPISDGIRSFPEAGIIDLGNRNCNDLHVIQMRS